MYVNVPTKRTFALLPTPVLPGISYDRPPAFNFHRRVHDGIRSSTLFVPTKDPAVLKIVQFWATKRKNWSPPSPYIHNFDKVLRLQNLRDLLLNADVAMENLFPGVEYRYETARVPWEPVIYIAWCRWPGREEWMVEQGGSTTDAKRGAALKALKEVLGTEFDDYCRICAPNNYIGVNRNALQAALAAEGLLAGPILQPIGGLQTEQATSLPNLFPAQFVLPSQQVPQSPEFQQASAVPPVQHPILRPSRFRFPLWSQHLPEDALTRVQAFNSGSDSQTSSAQASAENTDQHSSSKKDRRSVRYFDDSILKITPELWKTLCQSEREKILFDFWNKTSWGEDFPWTMNLIRRKDPLGGGALRAFMLLFSEGKRMSKSKEGRVAWEVEKKADALFHVKCTWRDQWGETHCVESEGEKPDFARNKAAVKALEAIFGEEDLKVLRHVHSSLICDGSVIKNLWNKLKQAKLEELLRKKQQTKDTPNGERSLETPTQQVSASDTDSTSKGSESPSSSTRESADITAGEQPGASLSSTEQQQNSQSEQLTQPPESLLQEAETMNQDPTIQLPPDDDSVAEFFSNNEDGTLEVPGWFLKHCLNASKCLEAENECREAEAPLDEENDKSEPPYLPFDSIMCHEYPQEAAIALDLLFEGRKEAKPQFEVTKYFLAEFQLGSQTFQALGSNEEEAKELAASKAVEALSIIENGDH